MLWKRRKSDVTYLEMCVHMDIFVQHLNLVNHTVNDCVGYFWCGLWRPLLLQNFTGTNSYGELTPANYCMGGSSLSGKQTEKGNSHTFPQLSLQRWNLTGTKDTSCASLRQNVSCRNHGWIKLVFRIWPSACHALHPLHHHSLNPIKPLRRSLENWMNFYIYVI